MKRPLIFVIILILVIFVFSLGRAYMEKDNVKLKPSHHHSDTCPCCH